MKKYLIVQPHSDDAILSTANLIFSEEYEVKILTIENNEKRTKEDKSLYDYIGVKLEFLNVEKFVDESYYGYFQMTKDVNDEKMLNFILGSYGNFLVKLQEELNMIIDKHKKEGWEIVVPLGIGHPFHFYISHFLKNKADLFYREFPHSYKKRSQNKMIEVKKEFSLVKTMDSKIIHGIKFDLAKKFYKTQSGFFWFEQGYIKKQLPEEFYILNK